MGLDIHGISKTGGQTKVGQSNNPVMLLRSNDVSVNMNATTSGNLMLWDENVNLPLGFEHDAAGSKSIVRVLFTGMLFVSTQISFSNSGASSVRYVGDLKLVRNSTTVLRKISNQGLCQNALGSFGGVLQLGPVPFQCQSGDLLELMIDRATGAASSYLINVPSNNYWAMWYANDTT